MRKYIKYIFPILCVLIVGITFYMLFDIQNKVEEKYYQFDNVVVNNNVDEDGFLIIDDDTSNTVEDTNTVEETNTVEKEEIAEKDDAYAKTKLDQAINLVKKAWGEDNSVYFTNEGVSSDGIYTVAARDKVSTAVKNYFKVNLETKKVEVDY